MVPGSALRRLAPALLLGGTFAAVFREVLFAGKTFVGPDQAAHHWPLLALVRPLWRLAGGLPLWSPFLSAGQPWAANPEQAAFHPLTALFLALPAPLAFRLQVLVPVAVAGPGMFLAARALGLSRGAALLAAVAWGAGGTLLSASQYFPTLFAAATLPFVVAAAARVGRGGAGWRGVAFLALAEGALGLAAEPTQLLLSGPLALVAAIQAGRSRGLPARGALARLAAGLALGGLVAAAALLPGVVHARKTVRARGLPAERANLWSAPAVRLAELAVPTTLGTDDRSRDWRRSLYPGRGGPFLRSVYPGLLVSALALLALGRTGRGGRPWLVVAATGSLLAAGSHLPAWGSMRALPLLSGMRYPEKLLVVAALGLTLAAAFGLDALAAREPASRRRVAAAVGAAGIGLLALSAGAEILAPHPLPATLLAAQALRAGVVASVSAVVLVLAAGWPARLLSGVAGLLVAVDLTAAAPPILSLGEPDVLTTVPPPLAPLVRRPPGGYLVHLAAQHPTLWVLPDLAVPPAPARWGIATALEPDFGLTELAWSADATATVLGTISASPSMAGPLLARRGVAALLRFRPGTPRDPAVAARLPRDELLELVQVGDAAPFAFCAEGVRIVDGPEGWGRAVVALGPRAVRTACVDARDARGLPASVSPGTVALVERRPGTVVLSVEAAGPAPAFVAVNQTWDHGWAATVDGVPVPLVRTDLSLSGLAVPPGRHAVRLVYRDPAITAGTVLSLLGLAVCGYLALRARAAAAEDA